MELTTTDTAQHNLAHCLADNLCGKCHQRLGHEKTFLLELPILILRVTPQAPMHAECANKLVGHPDLQDRLIVAWTCRGYEKLYTAKPTRRLVLRVGNPLSVAWWLNQRRAVADEVLDALNEQSLNFVLQGADQFEGATRERICLGARAMLEEIETKLLPKAR